MNQYRGWPPEVNPFLVELGPNVSVEIVERGIKIKAENWTARCAIRQAAQAAMTGEHGNSSVAAKMLANGRWELIDSGEDWCVIAQGQRHDAPN